MDDNGLLRAAVLASQLGFSVACPMVVFIAGGVWADGRLGTKPWLFFLGLVVGLAVAALALYQIAASPSHKRAQRTRRGLQVGEGEGRGHEDQDGEPGRERQDGRGEP